MQEKEKEPFSMESERKMDRMGSRKDVRYRNMFRGRLFE